MQCNFLIYCTPI